MIEKKAIIVSTHQGNAVVKAENTSCNSCSTKSGCSTKGFLFSPTKDVSEYKVLNPIHAKPGDRVIVGLASDGLLKSSLLAYLLPLLSLLVFAFLGNELFISMGVSGELGAILMGITGLLVGLRFANTVVQNTELKDDLQPVILRKESAEQLQPLKFLSPSLN